MLTFFVFLGDDVLDVVDFFVLGADFVIFVSFDVLVLAAFAAFSFSDFKIFSASSFEISFAIAFACFLISKIIC